MASPATRAGYGVITDEMVAREMSRVGQEMGHLQAYVEQTNRDAIRHWADGVGDMNPLWTNRAYARATPWGEIIAPPSIVMALDRNMVAASVRGFPGAHGWHLGASFSWHGPVELDRVFSGVSVMESITPASSAYAGGVAYDQTVYTRLTDDRGVLVCEARNSARRFERERARQTGKEKGRTKQTWSPEQIQEIAEKYRTEYIRGGDTLYVEDVVAGTQLTEMIRGPLSVSDCVAFAMAWGGSYIFAHGRAYEFLRRAPGAFPLNESGVPDSPERTHLLDSWAQQIGAPAAFDYGPQRIAWSTTFVTNWIGDAGRLKQLDVRLHKPNYHSDLLTFTGTVDTVDLTSSRIGISYAAANQLGELVCGGSAVVELPSRQPGVAS